MGGTDYKQGKQFDFAQDLFSIKVETKKDSFKIEGVKQVKSFGIKFFFFLQILYF